MVYISVCDISSQVIPRIDPFISPYVGICKSNLAVRTSLVSIKFSVSPFSRPYNVIVLISSCSLASKDSWLRSIIKKESGRYTSSKDTIRDGNWITQISYTLQPIGRTLSLCLDFSRSYSLVGIVIGSAILFEFGLNSGNR